MYFDERCAPAVTLALFTLKYIYYQIVQLPLYCEIINSTSRPIHHFQITFTSIGYDPVFEQLLKNHYALN